MTQVVLNLILIRRKKKDVMDERPGKKINEQQELNEFYSKNHLMK